MLHKSGPDDKQICIETLPCAIALLSREGSFCLLNGPAKRLIEFAEKDLLNRPSFWREHIHADDQKDFFKFREKLVRLETPAFCDYRFFPKNATEPIWIREVSVFASDRTIPWDIASVYTKISDFKLLVTNRASSVNQIILPLIHELQNRLQVMSMGLKLAKMGFTQEWHSDRFIELVRSMKHAIQDMRDRFEASEGEAAFPSGSSAKGN